MGLGVAVAGPSGVGVAVGRGVGVRVGAEPPPEPDGTLGVAAPGGGGVPANRGGVVIAVAVAISGAAGDVERQGASGEVAVRLAQAASRQTFTTSIAQRPAGTSRRRGGGCSGAAPASGAGPGR